MSLALQSELEHKGWTFRCEDEEDSDGFYTDSWYAVKGGERREIHHSRFRFTPTLEHLAFFVDNDFPSHPPECAIKGLYHPWSDDDIDKALSEAEEKQP